MTDDIKHFMLTVRFAGEAGIHRSEVRAFTKKNPDALFQIEIKNLVVWLSDKAGKPMFLALTWQGDEITQLLLSIAKNESQRGSRGGPAFFLSA